MKNLASSFDLVNGNVYMVEMENGEVNSFRLINETPTYYIFSFQKDDSIEVFEKAKLDVAGIYDVKEWWDLHNKD